MMQFIGANAVITVIGVITLIAAALVLFKGFKIMVEEVKTS